MLARTNLTYEAVGAVVANDGQGIIMIDVFAQSNEKSAEGLFRVLRSPGETKIVVSNPGVSVSEIAETNLQGMIYYIKTFKKIGRTCTHADVELANVRALNHQRDVGKTHKEPEFVPTVDPKVCPKTLETVEKYIIGFEEQTDNPSVMD